MSLEPLDTAALLIIGMLAGSVNAVAGGGPILTLAGLTALGVDPRTASLTSTLALCPGQLVAGAHSRDRLLTFSQRGILLSFALAACLAGGASGAALLLATDARLFQGIVGWLILFATLIYAFSVYIRKILMKYTDNIVPISGQMPWLTVCTLGMLGIYGGYFGGGNSFLIMALLALVGLNDRDGAAVKNVLVAVINGGAVLVFIVSATVPWALAIPLAVGGGIGSMFGVRLLDRINPAFLRPMIIVLGGLLAGWFIFE